MVELEQTELPTVTKIYQSYVDANKDWRREHLGASLIGNECERSLFYSYRWCTVPKFGGRILRLFDTGNNQEERLLTDLRNIGCEVYDRNPETGKQIAYEEFGGHFAGSLDAVVRGFEETSEWNVVECKTINTKGFNQLKSKGVKIAKWEHYCQIQCYLSWSGLTRAFYLCVCKETDEIYGERIYYEQSIADKMIDKAYRVIFANEPSYMVSDSDKDMRCRFCQHQDLCRGRCLPEVNCRTCAFSDVIEDGKWSCARFKKDIPSLSQRNGCPAHVFIPKLVPLEQTDADNDRGWIMYGDIINGAGATASKDLWKVIQSHETS